MGQETLRLLGRRHAGDEGVEAGGPEAAHEGARPQPVGEDPARFVPELRPDPCARRLGPRRMGLGLGREAEFGREFGQHLGVERQEAVQPDVEARQRARLGIVGRLVVDRRIVHRGFVARTEGRALVEALADVRRAVGTEPPAVRVAVRPPPGVVAGQGVVGEPRGGQRAAPQHEEPHHEGGDRDLRAVHPGVGGRDQAGEVALRRVHWPRRRRGSRAPPPGRRDRSAGPRRAGRRARPRSRRTWPRSSCG